MTANLARSLPWASREVGTGLGRGCGTEIFHLPPEGESGRVSATTRSRYCLVSSRARWTPRWLPGERGPPPLFRDGKHCARSTNTAADCRPLPHCRDDARRHRACPSPWSRSASVPTEVVLWTRMSVNFPRLPVTLYRKGEIQRLEVFVSHPGPDIHGSPTSGLSPQILLAKATPGLHIFAFSP